MPTRTITITISEDVARFLDLLPDGAAGALAQLAASAADGMRRAGSWEREWLAHAIDETEWADKLTQDPDAHWRMMPAPTLPR
jgi:hypothetical protein